MLPVLIVSPAFVALGDVVHLGELAPPPAPGRSRPSRRTGSPAQVSVGILNIEVEAAAGDGDRVQDVVGRNLRCAGGHVEGMGLGVSRTCSPSSSASCATSTGGDQLVLTVGHLPEKASIGRVSSYRPKMPGSLAGSTGTRSTGRRPRPGQRLRCGGQDGRLVVVLPAVDADTGIALRREGDAGPGRRRKVAEAEDVLDES